MHLLFYQTRLLFPAHFYLIEPDLDELDKLDAPDAAIDTHNMNPLKVLAMVKSLGGDFKKIFLVGCEPKEVEELRLELSPPVRRAVPRAIASILALLAAPMPRAGVRS